MRSNILRVPAVLAVFCFAVAAVAAQGVKKEQIAGISTFTRLDTTIACGGATSVDAIPELKKMGYRSIINVRMASEAGAAVEAEGEAARGAGMNYIHLPFNPQSPDPMLIDNFIAAVTATDNQPAYIHCGSANRVGAMWFIKRVKLDGWETDRAMKEAEQIGLRAPALRQFALDYVANR